MVPPRNEVRALVRSMRMLVAAERESGLVEVLGVPGPPPPLAPAAAPSRLPAEPPRERPAPPPRPAAPPRPVTGFQPRVAALSLPADVLAPFGDLPARVAACTKCVLCKSRTQTVFGEGNPATPL